MKQIRINARIIFPKSYDSLRFSAQHMTMMKSYTLFFLSLVLISPEDWDPSMRLLSSPEETEVEPDPHHFPQLQCLQGHLLVPRVHLGHPEHLQYCPGAHLPHGGLMLDLHQLWPTCVSKLTASQIKIDRKNMVCWLFTYCYVIKQIMFIFNFTVFCLVAHSNSTIPSKWHTLKLQNNSK